MGPQVIQLQPQQQQQQPQPKLQQQQQKQQQQQAQPPSVPAPTPTTAAATTPAAAAGSAPSVPAPTPTTAAAAGSTTPTDAAARRSSRTSKRNPDFPADHHAYWGDLPDSCTAECGAASSAQSSDDRRCRLFAEHRQPHCPVSNSTCTTCPDCSDDTTSRGPADVLHPVTC